MYGGNFCNMLHSLILIIVVSHTYFQLDWNAYRKKNIIYMTAKLIRT